MVILHRAISEIDAQVLEGLAIGHYGPLDKPGNIIRRIGDWNIRGIQDRYKFDSGYIVAIPSNSRTRKIYNQGRLNWLTRLGFHSTLAKAYLKSKVNLNSKWEHHVAQFVLDHQNVDDFILDEMLGSSNPKRTGVIHDLYTNRPCRVVLSGCQILRSLRELV